MSPASPSTESQPPTSAQVYRPRPISRTSTQSCRSSSKTTSAFGRSWSQGLDRENGTPFDRSPVLLRRIQKRGAAALLLFLYAVLDFIHIEVNFAQDILINQPVDVVVQPVAVDVINFN